MLSTDSPWVTVWCRPAFMEPTNARSAECPEAYGPERECPPRRGGTRARGGRSLGSERSPWAPNLVTERYAHLRTDLFAERELDAIPFDLHVRASGIPK